MSLLRCCPVIGILLSSIAFFATATELVPAVQVDGPVAAAPIGAESGYSDADWISMGPGVAGTNGMVKAMVHESGSLYAGGSFTVAGGTLASSIARWDGSTWHALGSGIHGNVSAMVFSGGQLYVAGSFSMAGGLPANNVARWDGTAWHAMGSGTNDMVDTLEIYGGVLHAAGPFVTAGGISSPYLAKWNGSAWEAFGPAPDKRVMDLQQVGNDLYACGYLSSAGGVSTPGVARWNGSAWSGLGTTQSFTNSYSRLGTDGVNLFVAGSFTMSLGDHVAAYNLAKWNGSSWSRMGSGLSYVDEFVMHQGQLHAVGSGFPELGGIAKWDGNSWNRGAAGSVENPHTFASGGGRLFVGGSFKKAGDTHAESIASYNGAAWSALGSGLEGQIHSVLSRGHEIFVTGSFTRIGNINTKGIARWDGSAWSAVGGGAAGAAGDMVFFGNDLIVCGDFGKMGTAEDHRIARWDGTKWWPFDAGLVGSFPSVLATRGNTLCVGGNLFAADHAYGVAKWNGTSWSEVGEGLPPIDTLEVDSHSIYAAASSLWIGNKNLGTIARWDGTSWTGMAGGTDLTIYDIVSDDLYVYISGQFNTAGGAPAHCIARWDGVKWNALTNHVDAAYAPYVTSLLIHGGSLYAGGTFRGIDGVPGTRNIARWDAAGGSGWHPLGTGTDEAVNGMVATDSGQLLISGNFTMVGKTVSSKIAQATNLLEIPPFSVKHENTVLLDGNAVPVNFGTKTVGQAATRTLSITLLVENFVAFSPGKIEGPHAGDFSVSNFSGVGSGAGDAGTFTVTFRPRGIGPRRATLRLSEAAHNSIPFDIDLIGSGAAVVVKAPEIDVQQPDGEKLVDGKAKIVFAKTTVLKKGESKTFVIRNTGTSALLGISVAVNGSQKKEFTLVAPPKKILVPGESTRFKVRFIPAKAGKRNAAIRIKSNDADESPFDINISGTGAKPKK